MKSLRSLFGTGNSADLCVELNVEMKALRQLDAIEVALVCFGDEPVVVSHVLSPRPIPAALRLARLRCADLASVRFCSDHIRCEVDQSEFSWSRQRLEQTERCLCGPAS
ncbi:hypothetical protein F1C10_03315 [Sphingomonas sp. NBWT7]|uniref:hypothetical protein n=1 Tax=Sphingomonas sp. NBWT7 TaxID=2596913 RepID=UPI00162803DA|nr:hypothetical protein [Sphingomonas sp. NBWT7]QNE31071.1 hypothetical protein F1C10_03315 [Sphingomonas sp. NBWT7]